MSKKFSVKKQSSFIVAALAVGVSGSAVAAGDNPFQMQELAGGYQVAHQDEKSAARGKHEDDNSGKKDDHSKDDHSDDRSKDDHSKDGHSDDHDHEKGAAEGKCGAKHMKSNEGKCGGSM